MTLNEKIRQLLLVRVPETNKLETIKKYNIGGFEKIKQDAIIKSNLLEELEILYLWKKFW